MRDIFQEMINDEGMVLDPYCDKCGKKWPCQCETPGNMTIGIGHNLSMPITQSAAMMILEDDLARCVSELYKVVPSIGKLNHVRENVLINMLFHLGLSKFLGFKKMLTAIENSDFEEVALQILDSKAARQFKTRFERHAHRMSTGRICEIP